MPLRKLFVDLNWPGSGYAKQFKLLQSKAWQSGWEMPTQACVVNTSMWYYCMGRLWKLRDLQPCWRRYVIIRSGLWRFLAAAYSCSFSASVYNLNEISQVPAPTCTPCLSSYYLAFYDCVNYHNQNQLGEKGLFHFIISGKSSWELKAGAEVLEECCLLACFSRLLFLACFLIPSKRWLPTLVGWTHLHQLLIKKVSHR